MPTYTDTQIVRLKVVQKAGALAIDSKTGNSPVVWRGSGLRIDLGFFRADETTVRDDVGNFATITIEVKSSPERREPALMRKEVLAADFDLTLTAETWADESKQHVIVQFSDVECNLDLQGDTTRELWLVIWGTAPVEGVDVVLGAAAVQMVEAGFHTDEFVLTPPSPTSDYYTKAESDARFLKIGGDELTGVYTKTGEPWRLKPGKGVQIFDFEANLWRTITVSNGQIGVDAGEAP